jgi:pimeloyl-ACP methyl ester carboxylesterase
VRSGGQADLSGVRLGSACRVVRVAGWGAAGLIGLVAVAGVVTAVLDAVDRRRVPPSGDLIELEDGHLLHLHVTPGPDDGRQVATGPRPTVVLEAGSGGFGATMAWLDQQLAEHTTVVSYDRAGYGFSDAVEGRLDAASVVDDLHAALATAGLQGPYVLVGHSLGAVYVRLFAAAHPDEVAGLVLIDPVHEDQLERLPPESLAQLDRAQRQLALAPTLARLGVFRLFDPQQAITAALPADAGLQHRVRSRTAAGMRAYAREVEVLPDLLDEVHRVELAGSTTADASEAFGGIPVRVISATRPAEGETAAAREVMDGLHRELVGRSPEVRHVQIEDADHLSLLTDAAHAREVTNVVVRLLDELAEKEVAGPGA